MSYSFCESQWADSISKWHIRKLTERGKMFGGGADTKALCGRKVAWDIEKVDLTESHLRKSACPKCVEVYDKRMAEVEIKETTNLDGRIQIDGREITEMSWDGKDLHVKFADDGVEVVYKNAYFTNHKAKVDPDVVTETGVILKGIFKGKTDG